MNYNQIIESLSRRYGNWPVKVFADRKLSLTYSDIYKYSLQIAGWMLSQGVKKGDCFGIWTGNVPEFALFTAASLRIGAVMIPINVYESVQDVRTICKDCKCRFLIYDSHNKSISTRLTDDPIDISDSIDIGAEDAPIRLGFMQGHPSHVVPNCEVENGDTIFISFTSGSTGIRKGIKKSLCSYLGKKGFSGFYKHFLAAVCSVYPIRAYSLFPWYHNTGLTLLLLGLLGARFQEITCDRYHPHQTIEGIKQYRPNFWLGTATMLYRCCLMEEASGLRLPRVLISTGEALPFYIIKELEKHSEGGFLYSGYGTTETGNVSQILFKLKRPPLGFRVVALVLKISGLFKKLYCTDDFAKDAYLSVLGNIHPSVQVIIFHEGASQALPDGEVGEICVHSSMAMNGYLNDSNSDIYLHYCGKQYLRTGDLGYREDELLFLAGRKKNLIIRSGEKILPGQVEQAAFGYPGVIAAVACGIPCEQHGEDLCLCLQVDPSRFDAEQLPLHLSKRLPKYACPQHILFWDEFPVNASGKTDLKGIKAAALLRIQRNLSSEDVSGSSAV